MVLDRLHDVQFERLTKRIQSREFAPTFCAVPRGALLDGESVLLFCWVCLTPARSARRLCPAEPWPGADGASAHRNVLEHRPWCAPPAFPFPILFLLTPF